MFDPSPLKVIAGVYAIRNSYAACAFGIGRKFPSWISCGHKNLIEIKDQK